MTHPILTGTVSITGTLRIGQTLTANTSGLEGSGTISFQWRRGTTNIGTNSSTYIVQAADVGSTLTVIVTHTSNSSSATGTAVAPISNIEWVTISTGSSHTVVVKEGGTLGLRGKYGSGRLGDGTTTHRNAPVKKSDGLFGIVHHGNIGVCQLRKRIDNLPQPPTGFGIVTGIAALVANERRHIFNDGKAFAHIHGKSGKAILHGSFAYKAGHLLLLPYGEDVKVIEKPHGVMGVKQVMSHLHIILEAFKWLAKVFHYAKLSFGASEHGDFLSCPCQDKDQHD